ncbi:MAG: hypothetical protein OXB86_02630 [Bdellovibrionales bacterium]|nr:hypothetical protein [Bdellovibrionales bacterium]
MLLRLLIFSLFITSCSTLKFSNRQKIYGVTVLASSGGAIYGFNRSEAKWKNALLFGASAGLIASLISVLIFNEEKKALELQKKLASLEEELGLMYNGSKIKYLTGGKHYLMKKDIPKEIKPFVHYGEWHLFELEKSQPVENWTAIGKNRLVKKNKMFELKAPKIKKD